MRVLWRALGHFLAAATRERLSLQLEIVALRHQLSVYERRRPRRCRLEPGDRVLWSGSRGTGRNGATESGSFAHGQSSGGRSAAFVTTGAARAWDCLGVQPSTRRSEL